MGFEKVEPPAPAHKCEVPDYREYGPGTVWVCDVCLTRYTRRKESLTYSSTSKRAQTIMWDGRPATDLRAQRLRDEREAEKTRRHDEREAERTRKRDELEAARTRKRDDKEAARNDRRR